MYVSWMGWDWVGRGREGRWGEEREWDGSGLEGRSITHKSLKFIRKLNFLSLYRLLIQTSVFFQLKRLNPLGPKFYISQLGKATFDKNISVYIHIYLYTYLFIWSHVYVWTEVAICASQNPFDLGFKPFGGMVCMGDTWIGLHGDVVKHARHVF